MAGHTHPQQWNGYTYSDNNPVNFSDPTGLAPCADGVRDSCGGGGSNCSGPFCTSHSSSGGHQVCTPGSCSAERPEPEEGTISDNLWGVGESLGEQIIGIADIGTYGYADRILKPISKKLHSTVKNHARTNSKTFKRGKDAGTVIGFFSLAGGGEAAEFSEIATASRAEALEAEAAGRIKFCSFAATTPVLMADGSPREISEIRPGDRVQSADPKTDEHGSHTVTATWKHDDSDLIDIVTQTGGSEETIHTTANHPFWDATAQKWIAAADLQQGHALKTDGGHNATVAAVRTVVGQEAMYNLTVEHLHTYYVLAGTTPVLVHNNCGEPTHADDCYCNWGQPVVPRDTVDGVSIEADEAWGSAPAGSPGISDADRIGDSGSIARGHAYSKHGSEFPGMSPSDLEDLVRDAMSNPSREKPLGSGRKAYLGRDGSTIVIHDPMSPDMGTVFSRNSATMDDYWNGLN